MAPNPSWPNIRTSERCVSASNGSRAKVMGVKATTIHPCNFAPPEGSPEGPLLSIKSLGGSYVVRSTAPRHAGLRPGETPGRTEGAAVGHRGRPTAVALRIGSAEPHPSRDGDRRPRHCGRLRRRLLARVDAMTGPGAMLRFIPRESLRRSP